MFIGTGLPCLDSRVHAQDENPPQLPFEIAGIYKTADVPEISGISFLKKTHGTTGDTAYCLVVSDKIESLFLIRIPLKEARPSAEITIGATLLRKIPDGVDLEGVAITADRTGAWLCGENYSITNSKVHYVPFDASLPVRSYSVKEVFNTQGNGAEALALVLVGTKTELWVGHERFIPASATPPIFRYSLPANGAPVLLGKVTLTMPFHRSQSDLCFDPLRKRVWVLSRELRCLFAFAPGDALGGSVKPDQNSFNFTQWEHQLNIQTAYGMAEGVCFDPDGLLYLCFDNN